MKEKYTLEVRSIGHDFHDPNWQEATPIYIKHWKAAEQKLSVREYEVAGSTVTVRCNWRSVAKKYSTELEILGDIERARKSRDASQINAAYSRISLDALRINVLTTCDGNKAPTLSVAECFVHDTFLIMNLSAPGSMNLYKVRLGDHSFSLGNMYFALSFLDRDGDTWPRVGVVEFDKVLNWYFRIRCGVSQIPTNRMEKVLFSLLHLSSAIDTPAAVIWIFYGLETIFDTRPGENRRALIERCELLLQPTARERKLLRENMRRLYDVSVVHGGLEVVHPMHNESLDEAVDTKWREISRACEFGFRLLLCAVQRTIEHGWQAPTFKEVMEGAPFQNS